MVGQRIESGRIGIALQPNDQTLRTIGHDSQVDQRKGAVVG